MVPQMSNTISTKYDEVLDEQTLRLLSDAPTVLNIASGRAQTLRDRVMQRIDDDISNAAQSFLTVRNHEGAWIWDGASAPGSAFNK